MKLVLKGVAAAALTAAIAPAATAAPGPGWDFGAGVGFALHRYDGLQWGTAGGAGLALTRWLGPHVGARLALDVVGARRGVGDVYTLAVDHRLDLDIVGRGAVADEVDLFVGLGLAVVVEERHHVVFEDSVATFVAHPAGHLAGGLEARFDGFGVRFTADLWAHQGGVDVGGGMAFVFAWPGGD